MDDKIYLGMSKLDKMIFLVVASVAGGVLGWFMPVLAHWIGKLPFIPFGGAIEWFFSLNSPWITWIGLMIGIVAGVLFSFYAFSETVKMMLSDESMELIAKEQECRLEKGEVSAIWFDHKDLVFLGKQGEELLREEKPDMSKEKIRSAFLHYHYPWQDADPYEEEYFIWVELHPNLGNLANTLLASREKAMKEDETKKAKMIRKELADLGVVIRDKGKEQCVRMVDKGESY